MAIEIVDLPINSMVDLSIKNTSSPNHLSTMVSVRITTYFV